MKNAELVLPDKKYLNSYLDACREFKELGLLTYSFNDPDEFHIWGPVIFRKFKDNRNGINLKEGYVPSTTYWLVEDGEFIGEGNVRHSLTPALERFGGHIGYAVRYSKWNIGYGTLQLSFLLREAARLSITRALVTCDEKNTASARVMEKNGGEYWDTIENIIEGKKRMTKRYWIDTAPFSENF